MTAGIHLKSMVVCFRQVQPHLLMQMTNANLFQNPAQSQNLQNAKKISVKLDKFYSCSLYLFFIFMFPSELYVHKHTHRSNAKSKQTLKLTRRGLWWQLWSTTSHSSRKYAFWWHNFLYRKSYRKQTKELDSQWKFWHIIAHLQSTNNFSPSLFMPTPQLSN